MQVLLSDLQECGLYIFCEERERSPSPLLLKERPEQVSSPQLEVHS